MSLIVELDSQCARRAIAEPKQCSQRPVIGWLTKIYYLELLRSLEGMLSRWSPMHLQSLKAPPVSRRVDVRQAAGCKLVAESMHIYIYIPLTLYPGKGSRYSSEKPTFYQN
jgi:hypothetical protein